MLNMFVMLFILNQRNPKFSMYWRAKKILVTLKSINQCRIRKRTKSNVKRPTCFLMALINLSVSTFS